MNPGAERPAAAPRRPRAMPICRLALAAGVLLLAGCSMMRATYNSADTVLRYMAWRYGDLNAVQYDEVKARLAALQQWHRENELPAYALLVKAAGRRVARGIAPEDVAWAVMHLRARYRRLMAKAAEDAAPVLVTLGPAQLAVLERKIAEDNADYAKKYLPQDDGKRHRAQLKRVLEHFADFTGDLTPRQEARIERFVAERARHALLRFEDRLRWQREAIALIRQVRRPQELAPRLAALFADPESRRSEEYLREDRLWEQDLAQLILDLDRTLSPKQRAHAVRRLEAYAEDFDALAAAKREKI